MQHGRIAGPYAPLYPEVVSKLNQVKGYAGRWIYNVLLTGFEIEEDWETDGDWVGGIIEATKTEIQQKTGVGGERGRGGFQKAWVALVGSGLVTEQEGRKLYLPYFKKKSYEAISAREIRERFKRLEQLHRDAFEEPGSGEAGGTDLPEVLTSQIAISTSQRSDSRSERSKEEGVYPFKGFKRKNSLSIDKVISGFYRGIGQEKISKQKRERAVVILKKLRTDGFGLEDIAFAVKWTLENAKEEPYDFSIIEHTIGQALAARDREEREAKATEERDNAAAEEQAQREKEEQEREEMDAYKQSLSAEERAALRQQALAEITASGEYKPQFVNDILIEVKENEILRKRLVEANQPRPGSKG